VTAEGPVLEPHERVLEPWELVLPPDSGRGYEEQRREKSPEHAAEELERVLGQAERTGDTLLARAAYHRAIDLGVQSVVDAYLAPRPQENRAWEAYTQAYQEVNQSRGFDGILERSLTDRAFSEAREAR
jgi:hypothetical protein